jgi:predicted acyltransferase
VAKSFPDSPVWSFLAFQTEHVPWIGCSFWDLIQPSFMFMVGVAMPYSFASRQRRGDSNLFIGVHVVIRALLLVLLGVFLSSNWSKQTNWTFVNVLSQIGLGYVFLFLLLGRGKAVQFAALTVILVGYTVYFYLHPAPGPDFPWADVGVKGDWEHMTGWFAYWDKNSNAAAAFDVQFLNLFPRPAGKPFVFNDGGYQTLNFIPSLATMILGLMAGEMLRGPRSRWHKLGVLVGAGVACMVLGLVAGYLACPIVKRIWTPSWALFSSAWTFWMLASFFFVIDVVGYRAWAFPFIVVGMNSIAMYCMAQLMKGWVRDSIQTNLGGPHNSWWPWWDNFLPPVSKEGALVYGVYDPIVMSAAVLLVLWLICLWMYRKGIFLKI